MVAPLLAALGIASGKQALFVLGTYVAASASAELIKGPLSQALSGIFPHEDVQVRQLVQAGASGAISMADFANASKIKQLEVSQRALIIRYVLFLRIQKDLEPLRKLGLELVKLYNQLGERYDRNEDMMIDLEINPLILYANSLEKEWVKAQDDVEESVLAEDVRFSDSLARQLEKRVGTPELLKSARPARLELIAYKDFKRIAESELLLWLDGQAAAGNRPGLLEVETAVQVAIKDKKLLTVDQTQYIAENQYWIRWRADLVIILQDLGLLPAVEVTNGGS